MLFLVWVGITEQLVGFSMERAENFDGMNRGFFQHIIMSQSRQVYNTFIIQYIIYIYIYMIYIYTRLFYSYTCISVLEG